MRKKSSGYTFLDMTKEVMEMEKKPLTVAQIWKYGEINNLTDKIGSKGKTPLNTLQARLYIDEYNNEVFLIEKKIVDNRYLWMYCQYDNSKLYGEIVLDTEKEKQHKNTRKKYEIELRKQLFLILDTESQLLYLSDITKKGAIKAYFTEELQADIIIKNLYSSLDEFQKSVKVLKKLKFTQYRNISNTLDKESIFMQQANELGLDMPEKIMMQIEYPNTFVGNLKNGIQILKKKKDQGYFSDIILIGEDDFGIEQSFDFTSIIKNIEVAVRKNEDDRYDENEVERNFFEKIR